MHHRALARVASCASLSVLLSALAACGGGGGSGDDEDACSAATADTYEGFGKPFVATYCAPCHGGTRTGSARMGAPEKYVFDSLAQIREHAAEMREDAVVTKVMPFGTASLKPSDAERVKLGAWLDCGAPE